MIIIEIRHAVTVNNKYICSQISNMYQQLQKLSPFLHVLVCQKKKEKKRIEMV
jgi:hypothetical protein